MANDKSQLDSWIVKMQNQERMVRQQALKEFLEFCQKNENLSSENAVEIFDSVYLCLIKCYSDRFEMCRSLSCSAVSELVKHMEGSDYYLSLLVPVIAKRLAVQDSVEESEEMRLQLLSQLKFIVVKYRELSGSGAVRPTSDGEDRLLKPYNDIIDILKITLLDSYPAVLRESCEVIKVTAESSPSFHYRAEALVDPLIGMLKHRHSPIRIAAIEALGIVTLQILSNAELVKRILKDLSPMMMDPIAFVKRECGRVGCLFLMKLRDRYSFFERILPLVLCCLSDETAEVRDEIQELWEVAGEQYYMENQSELQNLMLIEKMPPNYPDHIKRPSLGCRALVRRSLQVLNVILHEMEDWKDEVRLQSTKLLLEITVHSEEYLSTKYFDINAVLCKTCQDQDASIAKKALEVARLVGYFVDAGTWSKYVFEELKLRQSKIGVLRCLNAIFANSLNEDKFEKVLELSEILMDSSISHSRNSEIQSEVMTLVEMIVDGFKSKTENDVLKNLYITVMKLTAISYDEGEMRSTGVGLLEKFAEKCPETSNISELHEKFLISAIDSLDLIDKGDLEQIEILSGIICICGFKKSNIDALKRAIISALEHCEAEGKIKMFKGISLASMNWDQTIGSDDPTENLMIMMPFIGEIFIPNLHWKAGRTAESVRTMVVSALCALIQGLPSLGSQTVIGSLLKVLVDLIDDHNIATRAYALRILYSMGPLQYEQFRILGPALLSRLDDPGSEVREKAAKCLGRLELATEIEDVDCDQWESLLKQTLSTMLLHLESPEINFRESLIESIQRLSEKYPKVYRMALDESTIPSDLRRKLP